MVRDHALLQCRAARRRRRARLHRRRLEQPLAAVPLGVVARKGDVADAEGAAHGLRRQAGIGEDLEQRGWRGGIRDHCAGAGVGHSRLFAASSPLAFGGAGSGSVALAPEWVIRG